MICDDCQFALGLDDYDWYSPTRCRYECTICGELVPTRNGIHHEEIMDKLIEKYLGKGES